MIKLDDTAIEINTPSKKKEIFKNEITCIYNKQEHEIQLLHDYTENLMKKDIYYIKLYKEGKNNINEKNIDIYVNDERIKFNYKYKSNEKDNIKVKFVFNKLLTSANHMFSKCSSLISIDLSSFNSTKVNDMGGMFLKCTSLQSIDLTSLETINVKNMSGMFLMCSSLKKIDLSSFTTIKVNDMSGMFYGCSSLESIDLSSFDTISVNKMIYMFSGCSSLKKNNVKIKIFGKGILDEINKI